MESTHHLVANDTIVAQCTPSGAGAIAVIRISGTYAIGIINTLSKLSSGKNLLDCPTHTICHGHFIEQNGALIDEVLFFLMQAPKTFTGQDTVEISCHNNPFIISKIIEQIIARGARIAQPGEFSRRAVMNGKIDLTQAEAINELIHAHTDIALKKALGQLKGTLSHELITIERQLVNLLCLVEASFEFIEEEQLDLEIQNNITKQLAHILSNINVIKSNYNQQELIKNGVKIALIGAVNAGKSTLFNKLIKHDRAIVTDIAGTTRDSIEYTIYRAGTFLTFIDTAGIRQTDNQIEQMGIKRSLEQAARTDIILLITDTSRTLTHQEKELYEDVLEQYKNKIIFVHNKIDIKNSDKTLFTSPIFTSQEFQVPCIQISCSNNTGLVELEEFIKNKINKLFTTHQSPFILNQRQYRLLNEIETKLQFIVDQDPNCVQSELIAYQLKELLEMLTQLTGKNITEEVLDTVFNEFCVGK